MTPEQKRIEGIEQTLIELLSVMEESRMGFGSRFASRIRQRIGQNRRNAPFAAKKATNTPPQAAATPPAAPEKETEAA
jgi:hypothetical protein